MLKIPPNSLEYQADVSHRIDELKVFGHDSAGQLRAELNKLFRAGMN